VYFTDLRVATTIVQRAWRNVLRHRDAVRAALDRNRAVDVRWSAAAIVQRFWRRVSAIAAAQRQRQRNATLGATAVRLQLGWYKRNSMFTAFLLMRCLVVRHDFDLHDKAARKADVRHSSAVVIQRCWRAWCGRRRHAYIALRLRCVKRLQRWWRLARVHRRLHRWHCAIGKAVLMSKHARSMQRVWWSARPGRLLRSLQVGLLLASPAAWLPPHTYAPSVHANMCVCVHAAGANALQAGARESRAPGVRRALRDCHCGCVQGHDVPPAHQAHHRGS
jgi:hypothetical protein